MGLDLFQSTLPGASPSFTQVLTFFGDQRPPASFATRLTNDTSPSFYGLASSGTLYITRVEIHGNFGAPPTAEGNIPAFDNLRFSTIPEPCSAAIIGLAFIPLLTASRRTP